MANTENILTRRMNRAQGMLERQTPVVEKALGIGTTVPFGQKRLAPRQQREYWHGLNDQQKMAVWQKAKTPEEQNELRRLEQEGAGGR